MAAELNDVIQLLRMCGEKYERSKDLADERAYYRKRQRLAAGVRAFSLKKRVRDRRQRDMSIPAWIASGPSKWSRPSSSL